VKRAARRASTYRADIAAVIVARRGEVARIHAAHGGTDEVDGFTARYASAKFVDTVALALMQGAVIALRLRL
jgi:hypothetical protein